MLDKCLAGRGNVFRSYVIFNGLIIYLRAIIFIRIFKSFFDEIYHDFGAPKPWRVFDDVLPTIEVLRKCGTRLAVISNWDDRLCPLLESLELAREFEVILVSAEVGHTKPAPEIFQAAAEALQLPSSEILHVGDSENEDHHGAQAAGFQSRWLCRDSAEPIGHSIPSLLGLL